MTFIWCKSKKTVFRRTKSIKGHKNWNKMSFKKNAEWFGSNQMLRVWSMNLKMNLCWGIWRTILWNLKTTVCFKPNLHDYLLVKVHINGSMHIESSLYTVNIIHL